MEIHRDDKRIRKEDFGYKENKPSLDLPFKSTKQCKSKSPHVAPEPSSVYQHLTSLALKCRPPAALAERAIVWRDCLGPRTVSGIRATGIIQGGEEETGQSSWHLGLFLSSNYFVFLFRFSLPFPLLCCDPGSWRSTTTGLSSLWFLTGFDLWMLSLRKERKENQHIIILILDHHLQPLSPPPPPKDQSRWRIPLVSQKRHLQVDSSESFTDEPPLTLLLALGSCVMPMTTVPPTSSWWGFT